MQTGKEEVSLSLFGDDMTWKTLKAPSEVICKLETFNVFDKVVEYKVSIDKFIAFLYTNNKVSKQEILEKKKIPLITVSTWNKARKGKVLPNGSFKTPKRFLEYEDTHVHTLTELIIMKMATYVGNPRIQSTPHKNSNEILHRYRKKNLWNSYRLKLFQMAKAMPREKCWGGHG